MRVQFRALQPSTGNSAEEPDINLHNYPVLAPATSPSGIDNPRPAPLCCVARSLLTNYIRTTEITQQFRRSGPTFTVTLKCAVREPVTSNDCGPC